MYEYKFRLRKKSIDVLYWIFKINFVYELYIA